MAFFLLPWVLATLDLGFVGGRANRSSATSVSGFARQIVRTRLIPKAIQLLIATLLVTSMFALEMRIDIVPDEFGFLELLFPVVLCTVCFDLSGGAFTAVLTAVFAYYVFVPPRFSAIFSPGPVLSSLVAYSFISAIVIVFTGYLLERNHSADLPITEWRRLSARNSRAVRTVRFKLIKERLLRSDILLPAALTVLFALFWAIYGALSSENGPHIDSLEAYAWGREFRLGYFKHPPFWAWIAGLWFLIFPKTPFWFYLLSELNSGLGLLGTWALLGRFRRGPTRDIALLLLLLTPFYQFNALRFNANTILLSIWPWTMYFFVRSIEKPRVATAFACGLLAGFAMLSKYFGLVLIGSCFLASLTHRNWRAYFQSAAPYVSALTCMFVFLPHVAWLVRNGYQPLIYLATKGMFEEAEIAESYFSFIAANVLFFALPAALLLLARFAPGAKASRAPSGPIENGPSFLTVLALAPFVLTLVAGAIGHTALAVPFGTPIFELVPLALILLIRPDEMRALRWAKGAVLAVMAGCAIVAPFYPYINLRWGNARVAEPRREVAELASKIWKRETGTPLRYVTGGDAYTLSTTFYAPGNVSELRGFSLELSPWVHIQRIRARGLLMICESDDAGCLASAAPFRTPDTKQVDLPVGRKIWDFEAPPRLITFVIVPPQAD